MPMVTMNANWLQGAQGSSWGSEWSLKRQKHAFLEEPSAKAAQQPEAPPIRGGPSIDFGQAGAGSHSWNGGRRHLIRLRPAPVFDAQLAQKSCYMPGIRVLGILSFTQSRSPGPEAFSRLL